MRGNLPFEPVAVASAALGAGLVALPHVQNLPYPPASAGPASTLSGGKALKTQDC